MVPLKFYQSIYYECTLIIALSYVSFLSFILLLLWMHIFLNYLSWVRGGGALILIFNFRTQLNKTLLLFCVNQKC